MALVSGYTLVPQSRENESYSTDTCSLAFDGSDNGPAMYSSFSIMIMRAPCKKKKWKCLKQD